MTEASSARVDWYFDFISPFAYLQWQTIKRLADIEVRCRPVLFGGVLSRIGNKGPAEIPGKRLFTYRHVQWRADQAGIVLNFPPTHPFNPLTALRLCIAVGSHAEVVDTIFDHIWKQGLAGDSYDALMPVAKRFDVSLERLQAEEVKQQLRDNFGAATAVGVFGVPTLAAADGTLFWGEDSTAMFMDYQSNPGLFDTPSMRALQVLPIGVVRQP